MTSPTSSRSALPSSLPMTNTSQPFPTSVKVWISLFQNVIRDHWEHSWYYQPIVNDFVSMSLKPVDWLSRTGLMTFIYIYIFSLLLQYERLAIYGKGIMVFQYQVIYWIRTLIDFELQVVHWNQYHNITRWFKILAEYIWVYILRCLNSWLWYCLW